MRLFFGLELDQLSYPDAPQGGTWYVGPHQLLDLLETLLGLPQPVEDNGFLRVEQYRQCIAIHQRQHADTKPFYAASFAADPLAAAQDLLARRDELMLAGWTPRPASDMPERLRIIAQLEQLTPNLNRGEGLMPGFADRWLQVLSMLPDERIAFDHITLNEPLELLPSHFRDIFEVLRDQGATLHHVALPETTATRSTDLHHLQAFILKGIRPPDLQQDGSLVLLRAKRSADLASYTARLLRDHAHLTPLCLVPPQNRTLDAALSQEGLPSLGVLSPSIARPALQLLKLAVSFFWEPIDPYKLLEFVSLPLSPLEDFEVTEIRTKPNSEETYSVYYSLRQILAQNIANKPGLGNPQLKHALKVYFDLLHEQAPPPTAKAVTDSYTFWIQRKRYPLKERVPRLEVERMYRYLMRWAKRAYDQSKTEPTSLLALAEQSRRIVTFIEELPREQSDLSFLEIERIVRTLYEPAPLSFRPREVGHLPYIHHDSAIVGPCGELLWWDFLDLDPPYFFARWYTPELSYLAQNGISLETPQLQNQRLIWQRQRPILMAQDRLILCLPDTQQGEAVNPHPLYGNLLAAFESNQSISSITIHTDVPESGTWMQQHGWQLPTWTTIKPAPSLTPPMHLTLPNVHDLLQANRWSFSSLQDWLYYPYKWLLRYPLKFYPAPILDMIQEHRLKGNLTHKLIENLFQQEDDALQWEKTQLSAWVSKKLQHLMLTEGLTFLMYGQAPERIAFERTVQRAVAALVDVIRDNGWRIVAPEMQLVETFAGVPLKGIIDLVLTNDAGEYAIIDMKWAGTNGRMTDIKNNEDLQLAMYAHLLEQQVGQLPHTAYFIISSAQLLARNRKAFKEARFNTEVADHVSVHRDIMARMERTYEWRMEELKNGLIEVRTADNAKDLEAWISEQYSQDEILNRLEPKSVDAPYNDFELLIGRIQ